MKWQSQRRELCLIWHQLSSELFKKLDYFFLVKLWWAIISILVNISDGENKLPFIVSTRCCFYWIQPGAVSYFWVLAHTQQLLVFTCSVSLCFSLSFFSLVDLLLWLWPDDASLQHLMGWESNSFLCLWDHDVISYFGFFHHPDASVDVERMQTALSRCSQGSWKTIHGLFAWGILLVCLGSAVRRVMKAQLLCCQVSHRGLLGC